MLSQQDFHHRLNRLQGDASSFNMPGDQLKMNQQILIDSIFIFSIKLLPDLLWFVFPRFTAKIIQIFFLFLTLTGLIIFPASLIGTFLFVGLAATEWTSDILPSGISRISEKKDAAVLASRQILTKVGILFYQGANGQIIEDGY